MACTLDESALVRVQQGVITGNGRIKVGAKDQSVSWGAVEENL